MFYPERQPTPLGVPDRLLAGAGYLLHKVFHRRLPPGRAGSADQSVSQLRYRLRREGLAGAALLDAFALYSKAASESPSAAVLAAARWMVRGGIAELAEPQARGQALALAAFARALHDGSVHVLAGQESAAKALAAAMQPALSALGMEAGTIAQGMDFPARRTAYARPVVCATHREVALDYLRDRVQAGGRPGAMPGRLARLSGGHAAPEPPILAGLHGALVADADQVMLDDTRAPVMIAREVDQAEERLMYEQAIELARGLKPGADFAFTQGEPRLTDAAAELLGRLVAPLGGLWAARERREALVGLALRALHVLERDVDYRVAQGRVLLPERPPEEAEAAAAQDAALQMLLDVKEGCRSPARREIVARASVPSFFARYLHLAGICGDARGLEPEFWRLYALKCALAGRRGSPVRIEKEVFLTTEQKRAAVVASKAGVIAVRSAAEAKALGEGLPLSVWPAHATQPLREVPKSPPELVVAELHDARRHVEAVCAAYGAGSARYLLALEDEAVSAVLDSSVARWAAATAGPDGALSPRASRLVVALAQRGAERMQAMMRLEQLSRDQYLKDLLAFAGPGE